MIFSLKLISFIFSLLLLWIGHGWLSAQQSPSVNLPLNHFVYELFERWETSRIIQPDIRLRNRPFDRNTALSVIIEVDSMIRRRQLELPRTDRQLFEKLKGEFHAELLKTACEPEPGEIEKHLIRWKVKKDPASTYLIGDAIFDQSVLVNRYSGQEDSLNEAISYTSSIGTARGLLKGGVAFYADFTSTMIKGSDIKESNFMPTQQGIINKASNVYTVEANGYVAIQPKYFRFQFGKEKLVLGPGKRNILFLSDHAPAFDNLRLDVTFDRIKYTYFHGFLRSQEYEYWYDKRKSDRKYIAGHRVELKVFPWLFLAGNESVVYGGRPLETQYLNPVMIYHIAEQYAGDKDNNTMSFDFTAFPTKGVKTYGSLFLDDYRFADNPFRYWKQTWSVLLGFYLSDPFRLHSSSFRFEYARVEPFVYAHKFTLINYTHFETSLGAFLPPNSDDYFFEYSYQPSRPFLFRSSYALTRHGEGNILLSGEEQGYGQPGKTTKKFLMGVKEIKHAFSFSFFWEPFRHHQFFANYIFQHTTNFENMKNRNVSQQSLLSGYRLNY